MSATSLERLERLANSDPTIAPLAPLLAITLRAATSPRWGEGIPALETDLSTGLRQPLLHERTLGVDLALLRSLVVQLAQAAASSPAGKALGEVVEARVLDPAHLLHAGITMSTERLDEMAADYGLDAGFLATLSQLASQPLLQASGKAATAFVARRTWDAGPCPVCAAWPIWGELRGLERQPWLRCGRCAVGWEFSHQRCVYCDNTDHRTLGYLASQSDRESRRAATCDQCGGYLKQIATVTPPTSADLSLEDLATLELDLAALEQGYARPSEPAFRLEVEIEPLPGQTCSTDHTESAPATALGRWPGRLPWRS
ncbi:MAG: formate dehydrogenase accessory protein FdhE [Chloroflexi bacterium]|nr:formate dehydrogenase accessory protein FdhE [Chloroflexota bacterium]